MNKNKLQGVCITQELIVYAKKIVQERNILQADMTREVMGEILSEAMRRMEKAVTRYVNNKQAQLAMAEAVFFNAKIS